MSERRVTIRYRDPKGRLCEHTTAVYFDRGLGHYARFRKRFIPVAADQAAIELEDDHVMDLTPVVRRCRDFIVDNGDHRGVTPVNLAKYIDGYAQLGLRDRETVHEMLARSPGVAHMNRTEGWRFWPRQVAPEEAVRA